MPPFPQKTIIFPYFHLKMKTKPNSTSIFWSWLSFCTHLKQCLPSPQKVIIFLFFSFKKENEKKFCTHVLVLIVILYPFGTMPPLAQKTIIFPYFHLKMKTKPNSAPMFWFLVSFCTHLEQCLPSPEKPLFFLISI